MNNIIQTKDTCGQTCVAYIMCITLDESIKLFGHSNPTVSTDIINALAKVGVKCDELKPIDRDLPDIAIIKKRVPNKDALHWILKYYNKVYDPSNGKLYKYSNYRDGFGRDGKYIKVYENESL